MYVTQGLHRGMQQTPDVTMTICGGRSQSFRTVAERVARLAGGLRELGVAAGDRVAMLALNSDRYHEYLLAVPWAGAVLAPLNTRWSAAELGYALRDCEARVLIVDDAHRGLLDAIRAECGQLDVVVHCGDAEAPAGTVDYEDLIAGAGLDVFGREPLETDSPLLTVKDPNKLMLSPHTGWAAAESLDALVQKIAENIRKFWAERS